MRVVNVPGCLWHGTDIIGVTHLPTIPSPIISACSVQSQNPSGLGLGWAVFQWRINQSLLPARALYLPGKWKGGQVMLCCCGDEPHAMPGLWLGHGDEPEAEKPETAWLEQEDGVQQCSC